MEKKLKTTEAFANMIQIRGIHHELGIESTTVRYWRKKVNDNPENPKSWGITTDKMEELLILTGHKVIQEKLWKQ